MGLMKNVAANSRAVRSARTTGAAGRIGQNVSVDLSDWDSWIKQLEGLTRAKQHAIIRKAMRPETNKIKKAIQVRARSLARKGRKSTRRKGVKSLMRVIAGKLKVRALKRSRVRVGFSLFIAASGPEIEAARNLNPNTRWYAPAHYLFGHKRRGGGTRVRGNQFFRRIIDGHARRWFKGVGDGVLAGLQEHWNKQAAKDKFRKTA